MEKRGYQESFREALRRYRAEAHLTQKDLAELSGISRTYIIMLEKGKAPAPSDAVTKALEKALHIPEGGLLDIAHLERTPADVRSRLERASEELAKSVQEKEQLQEALLLCLTHQSFWETGAARQLRQRLQKNGALEGANMARASSPAEFKRIAAALKQLAPEEKRKLVLSMFSEIEKVLREGLTRRREEIA